MHHASHGRRGPELLIPSLLVVRRAPGPSCSDGSVPLSLWRSATTCCSESNPPARWLSSISSVLFSFVFFLLAATSCVPTLYHLRADILALFPRPSALAHRHLPARARLTQLIAMAVAIFPVSCRIYFRHGHAQRAQRVRPLSAWRLGRAHARAGGPASYVLAAASSRPHTLKKIEQPSLETLIRNRPPQSHTSAEGTSSHQPAPPSSQQAARQQAPSPSSGAAAAVRVRCGTARAQQASRQQPRHRRTALSAQAPSSHAVRPAQQPRRQCGTTQQPSQQPSTAAAALRRAVGRSLIRQAPDGPRGREGEQEQLRAFACRPLRLGPSTRLSLPGSSPRAHAAREAFRF